EAEAGEVHGLSQRNRAVLDFPDFARAAAPAERDLVGPVRGLVDEKPGAFVEVEPQAPRRRLGLRGGFREDRETRGRRRRAHRSTVDAQREKRQLGANLQSTLRAAGSAFTNRPGRERRIALARGVAVARRRAVRVMARVEL